MGYAVTQALGSNALGSLVTLLAEGSVLLGVFVLLAHWMRVSELSAMVGMVRGRLGR